MAVGHNTFVHVQPKTMIGVFANLPALTAGNGIVAGDRYIASDESLIYTATPSIVDSTILLWMAPGDWQAIADTAVQQYFGLKISNAGKVDEVSAAGGACIGIAQFAAAQNAAVVIRSSGPSNMIAGEAIAAVNTEIACQVGTGKGRGTGNKLVQATGNGGSLVGYNLTVAAGDGSQFRVALTLGGVAPTAYA